MKKQKILYTFGGYEVEVIEEFEYQGTTWCIYVFDGSLKVSPIKSLYSKEDTAEYKLKKEIERLKEEKDVEVKKIQDKAIQTLESRIRINTAFGDLGKLSVIGIEIANALKKIIEEQK